MTNQLVWGVVVEKRELSPDRVDIDAVLSFGESEGDLCKIKEYDQESVIVSIPDQRYLQFIQQSVTELESIVTVTFKARTRYVALDCIVFKKNAAELKLKFVHPNPNNQEWFKQAVQASEQSKSSEAQGSQDLSTKNLAAAKKSNLIKLTNGRAKAFLEDRFGDFLTVLNETLLSDAEVQSNDAAQHQYFDAIAGFKKLAPRMLSQFEGAISADASDVANGRWRPKDKEMREDSDAALSLVEKDEFEDWLIVRVATSRTELQFRDILIELQLRLDVAFGGEGGGRIYNPYGPSAYCHSFYQCIRPLRLSHKVERLVFKVFQERILSDLGTLYKALNNILIDADVLPDINVTKYLANQAFKNRNGKTTQQPTETVSGQDQAEALTNLSSAASNAATAGTPGLDSSMAAQAALASTAAGSFSSVQEGLARARNAYSTASRLWRLHSDQSSGDAAPARNESPEMNASIANEYNQALQSVRSQVVEGVANLDSPGSLKHYIAQAAGSGSPLSEQHLQSADMVETLFSNIVESDRIDQSLRSDLRKLEVPLLEVLLNDPSLFTADFHPARQAVNYIALLSDRGSINLNQNKPVIRECINELVNTGCNDAAGMQQVVERLDALVEKERKLIERNLSRVTEACSGQEKVKMANVTVERELQRRLEGTPIPVAILHLIDNGWRDLMRLCYFREGMGSRAWDMTLIVIDQLLLRLMPGAFDAEKILFKSEELIKLIRKGLSKVEKGGGNAGWVVSELDNLLHGEAGEKVPVSSYTGQHGLEENQSQRLEKLGVADDDKSVHRWMRRAKSLKEGQWLEFDVNTPKSVLNQLAWISEQCDRFVFVNHHGMKVHDISLEELALKLKTGDVLVLSDESMPAVEKGLDALIQKIYDQLAFDSAHDQLTGLKTRKEFERCIAQSVARAKKNDTYYVLIFVDILQFKVINNTCGYEVGDNFLREIANRIKSVVYEEAMIGRIGGNEFGVLIPIENEKKGYLIASEIKTAIEEKRFVSGDQSFAITAVVSLVGFDKDNNQVLELLRSVESAAEIGKKAGYKDIQLVRPGDEKMEERDEVMSWVARINRALDEGNLKVRCQMIYPIMSGTRGLPHFEVLLTVVDKNGEHLPPADFIKAAEEYSRMGSVDRWVIERVLTWMLDNKEIVNQLGGFSINLSGHSLNDETFLDFIFESLVRYQVPREKLIFEITETTAVANLEDAADFINEMRGIGCRFSLDDFGAGQSSYAYLKRLPVDFIKIDGAFVKNISEDDVDYALVKSITEMGHFLDKKIVAEFVSSEEILEVVRDIGVDYVQGFYLGKPVMIEDLEHSLEPSHMVA
ncbi:MAG: DUF1631 family protein [Ketobacter sp.]|nr:MAG: DUF1631 family protein [Ketobacter sp.]